MRNKFDYKMKLPPLYTFVKVFIAKGKERDGHFAAKLGFGMAKIGIG